MGGNVGLPRGVINRRVRCGIHSASKAEKWPSIVP
jgi:hypothetical protein